MGSSSAEGSSPSKVALPLSRASLPILASLNADGEDKSGQKDRKRLGKRSSLFSLGYSAASVPLDGGLGNALSAERPRPLPKGRPSSVFGSLGRKSATPRLETPESPGSSIESSHNVNSAENGEGTRVLHHGEVQTTSGLFRKKMEYMVLTETHLLRFKNQSRASDLFQSIPPWSGRSGATRHASTTSVSSLQEIQSVNSRSSVEGESSIPLHQIVAVYKVDDGRPFFKAEVIHLDEESNVMGSMQLMLQDPREADLWHSSIRGAAQRARLIAIRPYPERVIQHVVQLLEAAQDYDKNHFSVFRVVRRAVGKYNGQSSNEDIGKLGPTVCYLVIGINSVHLIPVPDFSGSSLRQIDGKAIVSRFGLVTLISMEVQHTDDGFELGFRSPLQASIMLELAASSPPEIAATIFRSIIYLKPQWLDQTFLFSGPPGVLDDSNPPDPLEEDSGSFDRTLIAYCVAYHGSTIPIFYLHSLMLMVGQCDPRNIRYTIDLGVEDAPEFRLVAPANFNSYTVPELLAIFRSLRYNESFRSISFQNINLQYLHGLLDPYGTDHIAWTSRSGLDIRKYFNIMPHGRSLLYQEVQALALKTKKVRRMNFGGTLPKRVPKDVYEEEGAPKDPGCEIAAALSPLCKGQLTNVDWIVLSGIELGETDLEELIPALDERMSHFRCVDVSRCGLTDRGIQVFLNHLEKQNATMECINISDNPGRLQLGRFPITMSRFAQIRKLDLSRATSMSGNEPLIAIEVMLAWRLEELVLTGVPINDKTLDAISTYVASHVSNSLRYLEMDQCNLTGTSVAKLLRSMARTPGQPRMLDFHVSANRLEKGNDEIVKAIEENMTSSNLTMRMVEYQTESRFRELLQALRHNKTIKCLNISKASLPYDAGDETCTALQNFFEDNVTLEELDISGEHAHLEVARFGIGLNQALNGLRKNKALKILKIEYQNLGLEGANTLSSVLEENDTLTHIYCEHNDINLQGFTVLVNAIARNFTVIFLPLMLDDQVEAVKRMKGAITDHRFSAGAKVENGTGILKHSVRKTLTSLGVHLKEAPVPTTQDIEQAVLILNTRWGRQNQRLIQFLERNRRIGLGMETVAMYSGEGVANMRPATVWSDSGIIGHVLSSATPESEGRDLLDITGMEMDVVGENLNIEKLGDIGPGSRSRSVSQVTEKNAKLDLVEDSSKRNESGDTG